jgi:hypothetical protein
MSGPLPWLSTEVQLPLLLAPRLEAEPAAAWRRSAVQQVSGSGSPTARAGSGAKAPGSPSCLLPPADADSCACMAACLSAASCDSLRSLTSWAARLSSSVMTGKGRASNRDLYLWRRADTSRSSCRHTHGRV